MSISIENISPTNRRVEITLPIEQVTKQFNKKLRELASKVRIDGFRPGKIPLNIIERKYGTQALQEARTKIMYESFHDYISNQEIPLVQGSINFEIDSLANEEDKDNLKFSVTFEVFPEVKIENINSLKPTKMVIDISDQDIEDAISQITKVHGKTVDLTEKAQEKNIATVKFGLFNDDGTALANMENKTATLEIGNTKDEVLQEIEAHIKGMKATESKKVDITFSDKINNKDIAGKTLKLELQLEKLQRFEAAELNDSFIKELGIASGDIEELRGEVKVNLVHNAKKISDKRLETEVMSQLSDLSKIEEIPASLISQEAKAIKQNLFQKYPKLLQEDIKSLEDTIATKAKNLVKRSLILISLIKKYKITLTEKDFNERLQSYVQFMENPEKALETISSNKKIIEQIYNDMMRDMCIKAATKEADAQEKIYSYKEALDYSSANFE